MNRAVHAVAGYELEAETRRRFSTAKLGSAYPVGLPPGCDLRRREKVSVIIHVLAPSVNPQRLGNFADEPLRARQV